MTIALPQLETFSTASPNILTTGTAKKSSGEWKPREAIFTDTTFNTANGRSSRAQSKHALGFEFAQWGAPTCKGPFSIAMMSVYTKGIGFAINSLYSASGAKIYDNTNNNMYSTILEITPSGSNSNNTTLRTVLKEYRNRQMSATNNTSGRVCVVIQGGINDASAVKSSSDVINNIKNLTTLLYNEWAACGFLEQDFHIVVVLSHDNGLTQASTALNSYKAAMKTLLQTDTNYADKITFIDSEYYLPLTSIIANNYYDYTLTTHCTDDPSTLNITNLVKNKWYKITTAGSFDWTTVGAANSTVGTTFTATSTTSVTSGGLAQLLDGVLATPTYNAALGCTHLHPTGYNAFWNGVISNIMTLNT
jgi:hypothetical protein